MDYRHIFRNDFKEWIALNKQNYPGGYVETLMKNERFKGFEDNMVSQIQMIARAPKLKSDRMTLKQVVYSMARMFADLAKKQRDEYYMSEIEKHRVLAEYENKKKLIDGDGNEAYSRGLS